MKRETSSIMQKTDHQLNISQQNLVISIITWNLFGSLPPTNEVFRLFQSKQFEQSPDVIFFATQQCQNSLSVSFFCQGKQQWEDMLKQVLNGKYAFHSSMAMQGLHSVVFVKKALFNMSTLQSKNSLKAGPCNLLGNKGAISISMNVYGQNLQFLNCHLAAHQNQTQKRNQTLLRILNQLVDKDLRTQVFLCGDMNYRIQMQKQQYKRLIKQKKNTQDIMQYKNMIDHDQLINQKDLSKNFFSRFKEQKIKFPPTYKMSVENQQYSKERIPGWTDRIFNRIGRSKQIFYDCQYLIKGSDHRPVIAIYDLQIEQGLSVFPDDFVNVQIKSRCNII